jgi:hypothetical protein
MKEIDSANWHILHPCLSTEVISVRIIVIAGKQHFHLSLPTIVFAVARINEEKTLRSIH